MLIKNLLTH